MYSLAQSGPVAAALRSLGDSVVAALPSLLAGLVFLVVAAIAIRVVGALLGGALRRLLAPDEHLVADLAVTVVALVLWFGAVLALLAILGLGEIAASLGSAAGSSPSGSPTRSRTSSRTPLPGSTASGDRTSGSATGSAPSRPPGPSSASVSGRLVSEPTTATWSSSRIGIDERWERLAGGPD